MDLFDAIDDCRKNHRILPCLVLIYAGIDFIASIDGLPGEKVGLRYKNWVDRYLLKCDGLEGVSAADFYAARCAVVHTFTPDSDLSNAGNAKTIAYSWGSAQLSQLQEASVIAGQSHASLHLDDLIRCFRLAVADYFDNISNDSEKIARFEAAAAELYSVVTPEELATFTAKQP